MMGTGYGITQVDMACGLSQTANRTVLPDSEGPLSACADTLFDQPAEVVAWAGVAVLTDAAGAFTLTDDAGAKVLEAPAGAT